MRRLLPFVATLAALLTAASVALAVGKAPVLSGVHRASHSHATAARRASRTLSRRRHTHRASAARPLAKKNHAPKRTKAPTRTVARTTLSQAPSGTKLLGEQNVGSQNDQEPVGQAEAFPFVASEPGKAEQINVYLRSRVTVRAALYADSGGRPASLLTSGSATPSAAPAWATISVPPVSIVAGRRYWIGLGPAGQTIYFRDGTSSGTSCVSFNTPTNLRIANWPTTFPIGRSYRDCPVSAYVSGTASAPVPTPPVSSPPAVTPAPPVSSPPTRTPAPPVVPPAPVLPSNTVAPSVSGSTVQGQSLLASNGTWSGSPTSYTYAWQDCNSSGSGCTNISGATSNSYTLTSSDVGHTIRSVVTAVNGSGSASSASTVSGVVSANSGSTTANLWVSTAGGSCTRSAGGASFSTATSCGSFQAAAAACQPGDDIRVVGGPYGSQTVSAVKASPGCTIEADGGASNPVTLNGNLAGSGVYMTYKNFNLVGGTIGASRISGQPDYPENQTYDNINIDGKGGCADLFWASGHNITWNGGSMHDSYCQANGNQVEGYPNPASNFTIEHVAFTNIGRNAACVSNSCHNEVIRIDDNINGMTIEDDQFGDMSVLCSGCGAPNSAIIFQGHSNAAGFQYEGENINVLSNYFSGQAANGIDVQLGCVNSVIGYNTHQGSINTSGVCASDGSSDGSSTGYGNHLRVTSNVGHLGGGGCISGPSVSFDHDVWTSGGLSGCSSSDMLATSGVFGTDGKHLAAGSPAIEHGDPSYCPMPLDIDGVARPTAPTACDAGGWQ